MTTRGIVTSVFIEDDSIRVTVSQTPGSEEREIRYKSPHPNVWHVPRVGDIVTIRELSDGTRVAHSPIKDSQTGPPDGLVEGDIAIKLNEDTEFILQDNGSGYDVTLACDGELNFLANDIYVGDKNNSERVATESHTHDFTYIGNGNGSSEQSGTTNSPNSDGLTDAEVE